MRSISFLFVQNRNLFCWWNFEVGNFVFKAFLCHCLPWFAVMLPCGWEQSFVNLRCESSWLLPIFEKHFYPTSFCSQIRKPNFYCQNSRKFLSVTFSWAPDVGSIQQAQSHVVWMYQTLHGLGSQWSSDHQNCPHIPWQSKFVWPPLADHLFINCLLYTSPSPRD